MGGDNMLKYQERLREVDVGKRCWWTLMALALLLAGTLAVSSCTPVMSTAVRSQTDTTVSFAQLLAKPEAYTERVVIFGGDILHTRNVEQGTYLEILQKPLDSSHQPQFTDHTGGRFMAWCAQYLDPAVYKADRQITIAGRVLGSHTGQVGEVEYRYPLLDCLEIHLWSQPVAYQYEPFYIGQYWEPWYGWYPWYWRSYHFRHRRHYRHR